MDSIKFEWDNNKAQVNIKKHGISFNEASTVFLDENAILFDDPEHSMEEVKLIKGGDYINGRNGYARRI